MKRILLTLLAVPFFFSCELASEQEDINQEIVITTGTWNILFFFDDQGDKAKPFANYKFNFVKDGNVQATKSDIVVSGTWSIGEVSNEGKRLSLSFTDESFSSLQNEWIIKEVTEQKLELVRFGSAGADNLVFSR